MWPEQNLSLYNLYHYNPSAYYTMYTCRILTSTVQRTRTPASPLKSLPPTTPLDMY